MYPTHQGQTLSAILHFPETLTVSMRHGSQNGQVDGRVLSYDVIINPEYL
jgi:hypothetical protein